MKVEFVNNNELKKVEDDENGTLVQYGDEGKIYGYGIVLKNLDDEDPIIYDLKDNCYYTDNEEYYVWREFDMNSVKFVIE